MKCIPKSGTPGTLDPAAQMGASGSYGVTYMKISVENKELLEIDKFSFICKIDGVDYLAKVRQDLGIG